MSRWRETAWNGDSGETRVLLGTGTWAIADHRETGGGWGGGGMRDTSPDKDANHTQQSTTAAPTSRTNTHRQTGEPFSHTHRRLTEESLSHGLPSDRLLLSPLALSIPPFLLSPPLPFDLPLSTLHCKSDLSKALGYLHTPATALYISWQFDYCICISVVPVVLCLTGKLCVEIFSTRKQPWLWIFPVNSWHA